MRIVPSQFVPSWPTFNDAGISARIEDIFSSHFPKFSASTRQYTFIFLGGALLIGASLVLFHYLKCLSVLIPLVAFTKGDESLREISPLLNDLSLADQQNTLQWAEKQALKDLKSWSFDDLLQLYRKTYVRGGRYQDPQRRAVWPEQIIPYVQKWRSEVLATALIQNFKSQITIDVLDLSKPADKELQLLAQKS